MRPTHGYCPACKEESAIDAERRCLWCGEETRRRRGGGKPKGVYGRLEDRHLHALHRFHMQEGISIRELGRRIWERAGYASAHSADVAIRYGFQRLCLPVVSHAEATKRANESRRSADSPGTSDRAAYKRWLRKRQGGYRVCKGVKSQPPRKGESCARWALTDSEYCYAHDPNRREEIISNLAAMRERLTTAEAA